MDQEIQVKCPTFIAETNTIGCMAHIIHLAACDGLKELAHANGPTQTEAQEPQGRMDLSNLIDKADSLYLKYNSIASRIACLESYLCQSPQCREKFIAMVNFVYDEGKNTKASTLLTHVATRWNSTYEILVWALQLKDAHTQFCLPESLQAYRLTPLEWDKVQIMSNFLHPLYEATLIIFQSQYPTIKQDFPMYILLIKRIQKASQQYDVAPMTEKLSKYLQILLWKTPVICATILDPCFKVQFFMAHETILNQYGTSCRLLSDIFEENAKDHFDANKLPNEPIDWPNEALEVNTNVTNVQGLYHEMYPTSGQEVTTLENELQQFLAEPLEHKDTDILEFGKSRHAIFPDLYTMAHKYLAIPASSAPSKRVFLGGCKILNYQRSMLPSMHVEQLACFKDWARKFGPIYST
ncbi:hypothetical protein O181_050633 [Austropuccinia psidii MF-1]|uniref:HAT C-terminal dimerisation domain-containing protein n=1 Tax=Austropuccinia psidii MF-1 TaxID=1389203 RepID=A0A9Q3DZH3_9BASI|nr:hypothetical protein [Austropuccinia psidii MF-1]